MARAKGGVKREARPASIKISGRTRTEQAGVYDALLFVSLGFLLMGMVFLVLELKKYGFVIKP